MRVNKDFGPGQGWWSSLGFACVSVLAISGCSQSGDGLSKYPVKGIVTVDGEPAPEVVVRFVGKDKSQAGENARFPVGVTNDEGAFEISTNGEADGAVAGDYDVTIVWPESDTPPLSDRLGGAYATPEKSKLSVIVEPGENVLPTFALKRPAVRAPARSLRSEDE